MNDAELIDLLQQKTPDELSLEEIDLLRQRMRQSHALRETLLEQLHMEEYLAEALGRVDLSVDELVARAQALNTRPSVWPSLLGLLVCLGLMLFIGVVLAIGLYLPPDGGPAAAQLATAESPDAPLAADPDATPQAVADKPGVVFEQGIVEGHPNDHIFRPIGPKPADQEADPNDQPAADPNARPNVPAPDKPELADNPGVGAPFVEPMVVEVEAEKFAEGNVLIDTGKSDEGEVRFIRSGKLPAFAEYHVDLPQAGAFLLHARHAAFDSRPVQLTINGRLIEAKQLGQQTGGWEGNDQRWHTAGKYDFRAGRNVIRIESPNHLPLVDKLAVTAPNVTFGNPSKPADLANIPDKPDPPADPGPQDPPPVVKVLPRHPWSAALEAEPAPFADLWHRPFDSVSAMPSSDLVKQWLAPVSGRSGRITSMRHHDSQIGVIDGMFRLNAPWSEDCSLQLGLLSEEKLRFHFFHGNRGVTVYLSNRHSSDTWAAYVTEREPGKGTPLRPRLVAEDTRRFGHTELRLSDSIGLRWQEGEIILNAGDVIVLRAPLPGVPEEVYLEGKTAIRGIRLERYRDFPAAEPVMPATLEWDRPADLDWDLALAKGAKFDKQPDGSVRLTGDSTETESGADVLLPRTGPRFVELQISDFKEGACVYLNRWQRGKPETGPTTPPSKWPIALVIQRDPKNDQLYAKWQYGRGTPEKESLPPITDDVLPLVGDVVRLRLLAGIGQWRSWLSQDGVHWAEGPLMFGENVGETAKVGIGQLPNVKEGGLTLRRITLREFPQFAKLAPAELLDKTYPMLGITHTLYDNASYGSWLADVIEHQPAGVDALAWQRACAVQSLAAGTPFNLGNTILHKLLRDTVSLPTDDYYQLLGEAAVLCRTVNSESTEELFAHYRDAAHRAAAAGEPRPFNRYRREATAAEPVRVMSYRAVDGELIRREIIDLASRQQWGELDYLVQSIKFYSPAHENLANLAPLLPWAEALSNRQMTHRASISRPFRSEWNQPLVEELSKEAYNVLAEFQTAIDTQAYDDACRIISAVDPQSTRGLLPASNAPGWLISLQTAIDLAMRQAPQLRTAMNERFGPLARLRVQQAIAGGHVREVALATIQFHGTEAAAEAHRWLGDRALSSGDFALAIAHFHDARRTTAPSEQASLDARIRLSAAMLGQNIGQPVTRAVTMGETSLSAAEFEQLVADMREQHEAAAAPIIRADQVPERAVLPAPANCVPEKRFQPAGMVGERPTQVPGDVRRYEVPWALRQMGAARDAETLYLNNRHALWAIDRKTLATRWTSDRLPGKTAKTHDWSLVPMRPVLAGDKLFARHLEQNEPVISSFDRQSGKRHWTTESSRDGQFVADPIPTQGRLLALKIARLDHGEELLRLAVLDPEDGQLLEQTDLVRLRDVWWQRRVCQVTAWHDSLIIALGGVVVCCDTRGTIRWARQQPVLPADAERQWVTQPHTPPVLYDDKLLVLQPGVRAVQCLEPESGRLLWQAVVPDLRQLVGAGKERIVLQTDTGLLAISPADGHRLWSIDEPQLADAVCDDAQIFCCGWRADPDTADRHQAVLSWRDASNGAIIRRQTLPTLTGQLPALALVRELEPGRWLWWGESLDETHPHLVELKQPKEPPAAALDAAPALEDSVWLATSDEKLHQAVAQCLPDWRLIHGLLPRDGAFRKLVHGERDLAAIQTTASAPVVFARHETFAQDSHPRLQLRIGRELGRFYKLEVRFAGETLWQHEHDTKENSDHWKSHTIELPQLAGKSGWLTLRATHTTGANEADLYWKQLELTR